MGPPLAEVSVDNYDLSWATNVMGPYLFTTLLMPALLAGANASADGKARIINTASIMHQLGGIDFNTFIDGPARVKFGELAIYCQSKNVSPMSRKCIMLDANVFATGYGCVFPGACAPVWRSGNCIYCCQPR